MNMGLPNSKSANLGSVLLLTVLLPFTVNATVGLSKRCGSVGTVSERIEDCKIQNGAAQSQILVDSKKFQLATRDALQQVWHDSDTDLTWKIPAAQTTSKSIRKFRDNPCDGPYRPPTLGELKKSGVLSFLNQVAPETKISITSNVVTTEFRSEYVANHGNDDLNQTQLVQIKSYEVQPLKGSELSASAPLLFCVADLQQMVLIDDLYGLDVASPLTDNRSSAVVVSRNLDKEGAYQLVLIGNRVDRNAVGVDASQLGFKNSAGQLAPNHINPQYLVVKTPSGPQQIFSFSLVRFWQAAHSPDEIVYQTNDGVADPATKKHYLLLPGGQDKGHLPQLLVNVPYARLAAIKAGSIEAGMGLISMAPYMGGMEILVKMLFRFSERKKIFEASKLSAILDNVGLYAENEITMEEASEVIYMAPLLYSALDLRYKSGDALLTAGLTTFNEHILKEVTAKKIEKEMVAKDRNSSRLATILGKYPGIKVTNVAGNRLSLVFVDLNQLAAIEGQLKNDQNEVIFTSHDLRELKQYASEHSATIKGDIAHWVLFGLYDNKSSGDLPESDYKITDKSRLRNRVVGTEIAIVAPQLISLLGKPLATVGSLITRMIVRMVMEGSANDSMRDPTISAGQVEAILEDSPIFSAEILHYISSAPSETDESKAKAAGNYLFYSIFNGLKEHMVQLGMSEENIQSCDSKDAASCANPSFELNQSEWQNMSRVLSTMMKRVHHEGAAVAGLTRHFEQNWVDKYRAWYRFKAFLDDADSLNELLSKVKETEKDVEAKRARLEQKLKEKEAQSAQRNPASLGTDSKSPKQTAPSIVFFVDGMRTDTFKQIALDGSLPIMKEIFLDKGVEFETYTSRSVSLPSWSTIISGVEIDRHGIRANTPTHRGGDAVNFLDYRWDLLLLNNWSANRSQQFIDQSGIVTLPTLFQGGYVGYSPINKGVLPPVGNFLRQLLADGLFVFNEIGRGTLTGSDYLDIAMAHNAIEAMEKDENLNLVTLWLSSIDHLAHISGASTKRSFQLIEDQISLVMRAAQNHKTLKNANIFLVSDHGQTGECLFGYSPQCSMPSQLLKDGKVPTTARSPFGNDREFGKLLRNQSYLSSTSFNIISLFLGTHDNAGIKNPFCYDVASVYPEFPDYDLAHLNRIMLNPEVKIEKASKNQDRENRISLDFESDNLVQVYLPVKKGDSHQRRSYGELTHTKGCNGQGGESDLLATLLNATIDYTQIGNNLPSIKEAIKANFGDGKSESRVYPVHFVAIPIVLDRNDGAQKLFEQLLGRSYNPEIDREPVLLRAGGRNKQPEKFAIIFTAREGGLQGSSATDLFHYVVLKRFEVGDRAAISWNVEAALNADEVAQYDPLDFGLKAKAFLANKGSSAVLLNQGRNDRQWLSLARGIGSEMPTAVFTLARLLTMDPAYPQEHLAQRQAEIPDFVAVANPGFTFNAGGTLTSDHGAFSIGEVRNSFFIGKISNREIVKAHSKVPNGKYGVERTENHFIKGNYLNRDILPTILDLSGLKNSSNWRPEWQSMRDSLDFH